MPYQIIEDVHGEDWDAVRRNFQNLRRDMNPPVPQARVFNDANISVATSGTRQFLTFNKERYDSGDLHSTSANTGRLTAPITGLYRFGACVVYAANATGFRELSLRLNGATFLTYKTQPAVNGEDTGMDINTEYQLVAGDYVEVGVLQTSGGALNVRQASNFSPEFWMSRVAGFVNQGV